MKIKQLSIFLQNEIGSLSKPLEVLSDNDINIRAMSMADTSEFCILRLVVDNPEKGKEAREEAGAQAPAQGDSSAQEG